MRAAFAPSRMYNYVRSRQLEGTYSNDPTIGCWVISSMRIAHGWGTPTETEWPYDTGRWPPQEPAEIDKAAKAHRILAYQRVRTLDECKQVVASQHPVIIALEFNIDDWQSAPAGLIPMPSQIAALTGAHSIALVGYDDEKELLYVRNSWGERWGDCGYGYIPYLYFERFQLEAWTLVTAGTPPILGSGQGIMQKTWGIADYLAPSPLHGFEIYDAANDEYVAWAFVVERDGFADIEEFFVRPSHRGRGLGRRIAEMIVGSAELSGRQLRLWVSHADQSAVHKVPSTKILQQLHLTAQPTDACRWAPFVAT